METKLINYQALDCLCFTKYGKYLNELDTKQKIEIWQILKETSDFILTVVATLNNIKSNKKEEKTCQRL